ncbi:MAG: hypothetical protein JO159_10320, partial [Acidobacteria bacterium]|nr:hypothetical protein [Acidobacteriota bacterium]
MMKRSCLFCLICSLAPAALGLDRHAFSVTRYDLSATVEPEQQRLGVRGTVVLRNDSSSPQKDLALQISSSLGWRSIQSGGKPVQFFFQTYTSDIDHTGALMEAILTLPNAIAPKENVEFEIGYEGVIPQDTTRLTRIAVPADSAAHSDWDRISRSFTAVRGIGYVAWYPVATGAVNLSDGTAMFDEVERWKRREREAEMQVKLCVLGKNPFSTALMNDNNVVQAPGTPLPPPSPSAIACSVHRYSYIGLTVPMFIVGNYSKTEDSNVTIYYLPEHRAGADNYALAVRETAPVVNQWFGPGRDHGRQKAQVVDLADPDASPFESGSLLLLPLVGDDATLLLSSVQHLTHALFPSPRPWISEGLARYAQASFLAERKGRQEAMVYLENHRRALVEAERQNATLGDDSGAEHSLLSAGDELSQQVKAMNVWWMLKDMVGEAAVKGALHNYKSADDKDADYMQKLLEAEAHRDLGWFFADWVYRDRGLPDFRIRSVYARHTAAAGYMVTVTVENLGGAGAEVPVTVQMLAGKTTERLVVPGRSKTSIRILAASPPQQVLVNDGSVPEMRT